MHYGPIEVNADTEFVHDTLDGMKTIIPYSDRWRKIVVQVSGGLDSALLLYLVSKNLSRIGSQTLILPLSFEVPTKAKSLNTARAVISKVRDLTGYENMLPGHEVHIPPEKSQPPEKDKFFLETVRSLFLSNEIQFELNGNTKNPPPEVRNHFRENDWRQIKRDNRTTIYNSSRSASPHAMVTKKGIVHLYKIEGILEELAPLTLSCDMDISEISERNLSVPCGECWWCRERDWGFRSNNFIDYTRV